MLDPTNTFIPASRVPLVDDGNIITREWYRFLYNFYQLAGGQAGLLQFAQVGNATGSTIPLGAVVGFAGVNGGNLIQVAPFLADGNTPSLYVLGIMAEDLPVGKTGLVCTWGPLSNVDTSAFAIGDILYPSPTVAGALTNVKPSAPAISIPVAATLKVGAADGAIFVRPTIEQMQYYGVFVKTTDQSPLAINTEGLLTFDDAEVDNGIAIGSPASRIVVPQSGLYTFTATIQLTSGSGSPKEVWFWFKKNGANVPDSARKITVDLNGGSSPISMTDALPLAANDYVELAFAADSTAITVDNGAATAFAPAAPAIVLTVTQTQQ